MSISELLEEDRKDSLIDKFRDFYQSSGYDDKIAKLEEREGNSLDVDMEDIKEFDEELYEDIIELPEFLIYNAEECLKENYDNMDGVNEDTSVRFYNLEDSLMVKDIREEDMNNMVEIDGIISKTTSVRPRASVLHFKCRSCSWETDIVQDREEPLYPEVCGGEDCGNSSQSKFKLIPDKSKKTNFQKLKLQEPPEKISGGENTEKMNVLVHGDLAGEMKPGKRVKISGILRSKMHTKGVTRGGVITSTSIDQFLMCVNITTQNKDFEDLEISDEDIKEIKEISRRKDVYDYLARSIAPTIKETLDEEKEAISLQLFSGGRKKVASGNSSTRSDIHILLVGDPGTGKSEVIHYVSKITPRGVSTSGQGSTSAGLTATATKNDSDFGEQGNWTIEAGALPLSDKGIAIVDEIDKMNSKDRSSMHEALEQQQVSISKAGINTTLKSRCSLLAAANPEEGRYNDMRPISEQINLEPPLVSRFDLIFIVQDIVEEESDERIADSIIEKNLEGQKRAKGELDEIEEKDYLDVDMYRKYVAYARREINPVMTEEAREKIKNYYVTLRQSGENEEAIPVTARKLEALIRLAEASARARLGEKVRVGDAQRVIEIVKSSIKDVGIDPDTQELDAGRVNSGTTHTEREKVNQLSELITIMQRDKKEEMGENEYYRGLEIENIVERAEEELDMDEEKVKEKMDNWERNGSLTYPDGPSGGKVKKIA